MRLTVLLLIHIAVAMAAAASPGLDSLIARGDHAFARIDYPAAREVYDSASRDAPADARLLWRRARLEISVGDMARRDERRAHYDAAERHARACVVADSTLAAGHTWLAAALGNIAMFEGSKEKVRLSREIKEELDMALRLDPGDDVAWSILGSFYRALGKISWIERQLADLFLGGVPPGGHEESELALQTAIRLAPTMVRHHFELGLLYAEMGRGEEAREVFAAVVQLPPSLGRDEWRKERAARWLEEFDAQ